MYFIQSKLVLGIVALFLFIGCTSYREHVIDEKSSDSRAIIEDPYVSRAIYWKVPTENTDGTSIIDFDGVNIYYSYDGPSNFIKGITSDNYLLTVPAVSANPTSLPQTELAHKELNVFEGSFSNQTIWVRATAFDSHGNESEFSDPAASTLLNVGLTNAAHIILVELENNGLSILLAESDGTETLQASSDLVNGEWRDIGGIKRWYEFSTLGNHPNQSLRVVRENPVNEEPIVIVSSNISTGDAPLTVMLIGSASYDPEGQVMDFLWSLGDGNTSTNADVVYTYNTAGVFSAQLTVSETTNSVNSDVLLITVTEPIIVNTNLVAEYLFDEGSGVVASDSSLNSNDGSIYQAAWTNGKNGGALYFDGDNDMVGIDDHDSLDLSDSITLMAWVKPDVVDQSWRTVVLKERSYGLTYALYASSSPTGEPEGYVYAGGTRGITSPSEIAPGEWSHLSTTYDGSRMRIYINGVEVNSDTVNRGDISASTGRLAIGWNEVWPEEGFKGVIDEVRIFNKALTKTEIDTFMGD